MAISEAYRQQVSLLIQVLPFVAEEECFALKGGTAINLFIRDLPRLSVDIDLTYLPLKSRAHALKEIEAALKRVAEGLAKGVPDTSVQMSPSGHESVITKMQVQRGRTQVKIEVTPVLRGCVFDPEWRSVSPHVEDGFGYAEIQVVSFADLYAGKIVAALDRQHPRDFFDVRDLLANEGVGDELRQAFLVYLLSGNRPISELLAPRRKDIQGEYESNFAGMTAEPVDLEELVAAREELIQTMVGGMPEEHKGFLLSVKQGQPKWELSGVTGIEALPAIKWRLQNLDKTKPDKRRDLLKALERVLTDQS